ncbi:MAG: hypothetical protein ACP5OX_00720 [Minisyncoccia bacterium]
MIENIALPFKNLEKEFFKKEEILEILKQTNKKENDEESLVILQKIENDLKNLEEINIPIKNFFEIVLSQTQKDIKTKEPEISPPQTKEVLEPLKNAIFEASQYILLKIASGTLDNSIKKETIYQAKEDVLILMETFKKLVSQELTLSKIPPEITSNHYKFYFLEKNTENKKFKQKDQQEPIVLIVQPFESLDPYNPSQAKINCKISQEKDISLRLDRNEKGFYVDISSKNIDSVTNLVDKKIKEEVNTKSELGKILKFLAEKSPKTHHFQIEKIPLEFYQKSRKAFAFLSLNFLKLLNRKYELQKKFSKQNFKKFQQEKLNEIYE